jgi:CDP-paratose 2-epimerase
MDMNILITGGAGFIGTNVAEYYAARGDEVLVLDNLSRVGSSLNLKYLREKNTNIKFVNCDIRNYNELLRIFRKESFDAIFHLAAQVAVTTSVKNPREDFEINALGTFNVLEAMRETNSKGLMLYSSTNKVYGGMENIVIREKDGRYQYRNFPNGISENNPLDFHSPYGCSKGAADQYTIDYSRIYGLKTVAFRQSCIYGYRQFGIEDQGWVAWFTIAAAFGKTITIYGDGKQVRDVLFIDDLIKVFDIALGKENSVNGKAYNIGGGHFQMSLLELIGYLEEHLGIDIPTKFSDWRPGDQRVYVSDISKAKKDLKWIPQIPPEEGVEKLFNWVKAHKKIFQDVGIVE